MNRTYTLLLLVAAGTIIASMTGYYVLTALDNNNAVVRHGIVSGVLFYNDKPSAIIDSNIVYEGDVIHGVRVVRILRDKVEFEKNRKRWVQAVKQQPNFAWPKVKVEVR